MIRALVWKEYREHRAVWLTMAVVGVAGLFGVAQLVGEGGGYADRARDTLRVVAVVMAWSYGLVCGAMMLAGEREGGTLDFLDTLPARRRDLWWTKCLVGVALVLGQVALVSGASVAVGAGEGSWLLPFQVLGLLLIGLFGFGWGMLFSARGHNVLNVIGLALVGQVAGCFGMLLVVLVLTNLLAPLAGRGNGLVEVGLMLLGLGMLTFGPLAGSAHVFGAPDRLRGGSESPLRDLPPPRGGWGRLFWLSLRQARGLALGLLLFCLVAGLALPLSGLLGWPLLTLGVGVLCGVTAFVDEQISGSFRFLGDQRLPLGRVWLVRMLVRFALAGAACLVLLLPGLVGAVTSAPEHPLGPQASVPPLARVFRGGLLGPVVPPLLFLSMWVVYGFCVGHLGGVLFRKSLVAFVISFGVSALLASVWAPSLLGGGLHGWQVLGVPLVFLLTGRLLMRTWTAGRLVSRGTFVGLGLAGVVSALLIAGGVWYRVAEVPDVPDTFDMPAFVKSLPAPEQNEAGLAIRSACAQFATLRGAHATERPTRPLFPGDRWAQGQMMDFESQAAEVVERGWPRPAGGARGRLPEEPELGRWLDRLFAGEWPKQLAEAARLPLGIVEDPRNITFETRLQSTSQAGPMGTLLAARGLQLQARGDDAAFVANLRAGLALARNLQHSSTLIPALTGQSVERRLLAALDRWLERLDGHPELLREALEVLVEHEHKMPAVGVDQEKAEYLEALNSVNPPEAWLEMVCRERGADHPGGPEQDVRRLEYQAAGLAWQVPWEKERHDRILRALFEGHLRPAHRLADGILPIPSDRTGKRIREAHTLLLCRLRAAQLEVALRLYQASNNGRPADTLDVLVPAYLKAIPADPFDGAPFRYRLSRGEGIEWPAPTAAGQPGGGGPAVPAEIPGPDASTRPVPPGQGILWSVGEDKTDDGGRRQVNPLTERTSPGEDRIFLVPLPPKKGAARGG